MGFTPTSFFPDVAGPNTQKRVGWAKPEDCCEDENAADRGDRVLPHAHARKRRAWNEGQQQQDNACDETNDAIGSTYIDHVNFLGRWIAGTYPAVDL
jgi:hypothetical protein